MHQALGAVNSFAVKLAAETQTAFAVEAVAASQVRDLAQHAGHWKGRVFLPMLQGVGTAMVIEKGLDKAPQNLAVLVMELADGSMQGKWFQGDALIMVAWALASTLALLNEAGFIHGDLKPANVLWQANIDATLIPQGSSEPQWMALAHRLRQRSNFQHHASTAGV